MNMNLDSVRERTLGDGMEHSDSTSNESQSKETFSFELPQKPSQSILNSMRPIIPTTKIYKTVPIFIPNERRNPKYLIRKPKEPKFIPYEPFKGAVQPIVAKKRKLNVPKVSRNNIEIHDLVNQMADLRTAELTKKESVNEDSVISKKEWEQERRNYQNDIKNLRESNNVLENQLKLQTQVNSELKTLLVAAVGEDLETRVQHLTEDKLHLARALLKSANNLTTHQEQTEWLSGQCEVWKSKFLASSLMVEELAKWKLALSGRIKELQSAMSKILDDRRHVHRALVETTFNLQELSRHFRLQNEKNKISALNSVDIVTLSNYNMTLSKELFDKFLKYEEDDFGKFYNEIMDVPQRTDYEEKARKLLQEPITIAETCQDDLYRAVLGEAGAAASEHFYVKPNAHSTCCSHCMGEMKDI